MINDWHIRFLRLATPQELSSINEMALRVNALLREYLDKRDIVLVDMKLEFGRHHGRILLADEICPDTCRFWDKSLGGEARQGPLPARPRRSGDAYHEAARRICAAA
jgi:phosphoribosylaminoimidazole-succinocarboxamide synthase